MKHAPLVVAVLVMLLAVVALGIAVTDRTGGELVYTLDDPYIHMAVAKNLASHGVWGVTSHGFTSSSSSPLWTGLISAVFVFTGPSPIVPLALALASAAALLIAVYVPLRRHGAGPIWTGLVLLVVVFFTPLPPLVFSGLEHLLHAALSVSFLYCLASFVSCDADEATGNWVPALLALAALLALVRYEGLLLVFVACLALLLRGTWKEAVLVGMAAVAPLAVYGLVSWSNGWYPLPNAVLIKGARPDFSLVGLVLFALGYAQNRDAVGIRNLLRHDHLLVLLAGTLIAFVHLSSRRIRPWDMALVMLGVLSVTVLLHLQLAGTGWFYRYEAYLLVAGFFALGFLFKDLGSWVPTRLQASHLPAVVAVAILAWISVWPFVERSIEAFHVTPQASRNIHDQQVQMGRFVARYYDSAGVAANDIGAITFFGNPHLVDVVGLADMDVAEAKRSGSFDLPFLRDLLRRRDARVAIVADEVLPRWGIDLAEAYELVAQWTIPDNVISVSETVSFYSLHPAETERLRASLDEFSRDLPQGVVHRAIPAPAARESGEPSASVPEGASGSG